jgi:ribonuclease P protein component
VQTFSKNERLINKVIIDKLFDSGKSFNNYPLKIIWLELKGEIPNNQILFTVPKRLFKKAVDRNKLKRLMREAYRKNKSIINQKTSSVGIIVVYLDKEKINYKDMNMKIITSLERLNKEMVSVNLK